MTAERPALRPEKRPAEVLSVNVGMVREFEFNGRPARSAIWKSPVRGRVAVRGVNLAGDEQADRKAHGGPDKAVYAYAIEDYRWWEDTLGRALEHGELGENLTTQGVDVNGARVGEHWRIGSVLLEVSEPRVPCWRLGVRMHDASFPKRFFEALRPGAYLRIVEEGDLGAGDAVEVVDKPTSGLTVQDVFRIFSRDRSEAGRILATPRMSAAWKAWARKIVAKSDD